VIAEPIAASTSYHRVMAVDEPEVARDYHAGGEYAHTPDALWLSLTLGGPLALEQLTDGRLWSGRSIRGTINVIPPGVPRVFRHREGCHFACVTIPSQRELRPYCALDDAPLRRILESLVAAADAGEASRLVRDAAAHDILERLDALDGQPRKPVGHRLAPATAARLMAYLDARLAHDVSVDELARTADLSPAHFSVLFRASFGEPPHRHILRLRVERARVMLEQGADPAAAALAVGFYDQSHLGRHMRRLLGVTPGAISRARRG
jgi:AraC family transcriptional regulator